MIFCPGTAVWVEHPELAWAEAEVVSLSSPSFIMVVLSSGVKVIERPKFLLPTARCSVY
jgi:myosin-5